MEDQRGFHLTELGLTLFKKRNLHSVEEKMEGFHCNIRCLKILFLTVKKN